MQMADGHAEEAEETEEDIWVKRRPYGPSDDDGAIWTIWIPEARKSKWWVFSRQIENLIFGTERPHDPGFFLSMLNHHPPLTHFSKRRSSSNLLHDVEALGLEVCSPALCFKVYTPSIHGPLPLSGVHSTLPFCWRPRVFKATASGPNMRVQHDETMHL